MDKWLRGEPGARIVKKNAKGVIEGDIGVRPPVPGAQRVPDHRRAHPDHRRERPARGRARGGGRGRSRTRATSWRWRRVPSFDPEPVHPQHLHRGLDQAHQGRHQPADQPRDPVLRAGFDLQDDHRAGRPASRARATTSTPARAASPTATSTCTAGSATKGGSHGTLDLTDAPQVLLQRLSSSSTATRPGSTRSTRWPTSSASARKRASRFTNEAPGRPARQGMARQTIPEGPLERRPHGQHLHRPGLRASAARCRCRWSPRRSPTAAPVIIPALIDRVVDHDGQDVVDPDTGKPVAQGPRVRTQPAGPRPQARPDREGAPGHVEGRQRPGRHGAHARSSRTSRSPGKTGTAQFWRNGVKDNHTWFICFAPYQKPKYAVCVFIQGAKGGGITAAPIAAQIWTNPSRSTRARTTSRQAAGARQGQLHVHQQHRLHAPTWATRRRPTRAARHQATAARRRGPTTASEGAVGRRRNEHRRRRRTAGGSQHGRGPTSTHDRHAELRAAPDDAGRVRKPKPPSWQRPSGNGNTPPRDGWQAPTNRRRRVRADEVDAEILSAATATRTTARTPTRNSRPNKEFAQTTKSSTTSTTTFQSQPAQPQPTAPGKKFLDLLKWLRSRPARRRPPPSFRR